MDALLHDKRLRRTGGRRGGPPPGGKIGVPPNFAEDGGAPSRGPVLLKIDLALDYSAPMEES